MRIALATDHAGFKLKEALKPFLESLGHEVVDFGAHQFDPADDYPDFVIPAARAVAEGKADRAIVIGSSGQGEAMAANRVKGARAMVFYGDVFPQGLPGKVGKVTDVVTLGRADNDSNVLSIAGAFVGVEDAKNAIRRWLETPFTDEERHVRRIKKLDIAEGEEGEFDKWNENKKEIHAHGWQVFFREREIWWCSFGKNVGHEQDGTGAQFDRPAVVLKKFNPRICLVVPLSTTTKTGRYYFDTGIVSGAPSKAILSQIRLVDSKRFRNRIGKVSPTVFVELKKAVAEISIL